MFCHNCGAKAHGAYCSQCGTKIVSGEGEPEPTPPVHGGNDDDWVNEIRYEVLLNKRNVRDLIAQHAAQYQKRMSAEEFLGLCDKAFSSVPGLSLTKIGAIAQPLFADLGVKTGKNRVEVLNAPPGRVIVAILCSLARRGQSMSHVDQAQDGCLIRAALPSDMWSFAGDLLITVKRHGQGTAVEAATAIKGQLYDWGKSKRILSALFEDISGSRI